MGFVEVAGSDDMSVDEILEEADSRMYDVKTAKKRRGEGISVPSLLSGPVCQKNRLCPKK